MALLINQMYSYFQIQRIENSSFEKMNIHINFSIKFSTSISLIILRRDAKLASLHYQKEPTLHHCVNIKTLFHFLKQGIK